MRQRPNKPEPTVIKDYSRMRKSPPHSPVHLLYALLLAVATGGALWQHGHPAYTIGLILAVIPCSAMVYLPYRYFDSMMRTILNCLLFGGILCWVIFRLRENMPDKVLVEALCATCLIFLMNGRPKDYFYLFFITLFLFVYGSLLPRIAFLYLFGAALVLFLAISYYRKTSAIAGIPVIRELPFSLRRNWPFFLVQLLIAGGIFWFIFALMPLKDNEVPGLFETSFLTQRESILPPALKEWMKPQKTKPSDTGTSTANTGAPPTALDSQGRPMNIPNAGKSKSLIDGNGGASQGQDLVFYVKSPVKLYHLARLYDEYDGNTWTSSPQLQRVRLREYKEGAQVAAHVIEQNYTIVKLLSKRLYAAFLPTAFTLQGDFLRFRLKNFFYGSEFMEDQMISVPFKYDVAVQVFIPLPKQDSAPAAPAPPPPLPAPVPAKGGKPSKAPPLPPDPAWNESLAKPHYLALPQKKISKRVRDLAQRITAQAPTPYEKALALRDYLRTNYKYKLNAEKLPPDKEAADYFLFELKEGHCEYFAAALAVLARAVKLPSRVATGFSPGNYNTLTNLFEVYEYHAHAWTQIFIDNLGWLTMDGTPPSEITSNPIPAGIGRLRDPFGDEWKITPPELAEKTQDFLRKDILEKAKKNQELSVIDSTLVKAVVAEEKLRENVKNKYAKAVEKIKKEEKKGGIIYKIKDFYKKAVQGIGGFFSRLYDLVFSAWLLLITAVMLLVVLFNFTRMVIFEFKRKRRLRRMNRHIAEAETLFESNPRKSILNTYQAFRIALDIAGFERKLNQELLDFADDLAKIDITLGENARSLFIAFYKAEYGSSAIAPDEARTTFSRFTRVEEFLLKNICVIKPPRDSSARSG